MLFVSNLQEQERSRQYQKQLEDIKSQINKSGNKSAVCVNLSCRDKADPIQCIYLFVYVYFCVNTNNIFVYYFWLQIKLLDKIIQKEIKSQPNGLIQKARYIYIYEMICLCALKAWWLLWLVYWTPNEKILGRAWKICCLLLWIGQCNYSLLQSHSAHMPTQC